MRDRRLDLDPDFIVSPKHGNSLKRFLDENPNGVENAVVARVMKLSEQEVEETFQRALIKLREAMQVNE